MYRDALRHASAFAITAVCIVVLGVLSRGMHRDPSFYGVAAQVLPVFLLVVAVEGRFFREQPQRGDDSRVARAWLLRVPIAGELAALAILSGGPDVIVSRGLVLTGLFATFVLFLLFATDGPRPQTRAPRRR